MARGLLTLLVGISFALVSSGCNDQLPPLLDRGLPQDGGTLDTGQGPLLDGPIPRDGGPAPDMLPAACFDNGNCLDAAYCHFEQGCEGPGTCLRRPTACDTVEAPVCACDGQTFGNACLAAAAGVNVADPNAPCPPKPCWNNSGCTTQELCNLDGHCGEANRPGSCEAKPMGCFDIWDPVCGCDGQTYGNDCDAHSSGASIRYQGECNPNPPDCQTLEADYAQALAAAKSCIDPSSGGLLACDKAVASSLICQCPTYVASAHAQEITKMDNLLTAWANAGCGDNGPVCDCLPVVGGACQTLSGGARCVDLAN